MKKIEPLKAGGKVKRTEWKIRVLHSDRNETRYHAHSGLLTILYKNKEGLSVMYEWAKANLKKEALLAVSDEYHKRRREGA